MDKCPVCKIDLSPLDLASKNEHIEDCIENGPTILDVDESGRVIRKTNLPMNKQRKICPICDKTYQTIHNHFKACALKNDLPPQLMLDHWEQLNTETKASKKFPRELLDNFISKSIREGRVGEQVDYAKALLLSMYVDEPESKRAKKQQAQLPRAQQQQQAGHTNMENEETNQSTISMNSEQQQVLSGTEDSNFCEPQQQQQKSRVDVDQILMPSNEASCSSSTTTTGRRRGKEPKKFALELVDDETKEYNIQLRIEREVAASQRRRYLESLKNHTNSDTKTTTPADVESSSTQEVQIVQ